MGNGNFDVGSKTPTRRNVQPIVEQMKGSGSSEARIDQQMQSAQPQNCGAMSQQGSSGFHGNVSSPQKLPQLVGCREPKVRAEPWIRPARR